MGYLVVNEFVGDDDTTVAEYFQEYQSRVVDALSDYHSTKQYNQDLQSKVDTLKREKELFQKLLEERDMELEVIAQKVLAKTTEVIERLGKISTDFVSQKKIVNLQYDVDIALSANRALEKDLILQRTENERLRNLNSQLTRELQYYKMQMRSQAALSTTK